MTWKEIGEKTLAGVLSAMILGALLLGWNWASHGGLITVLGGVPRSEMLLQNVTGDTFPSGVTVFVDNVRGCQVLGAQWEDSDEGGQLIAAAIKGDNNFSFHQHGGKNSIVLDSTNMPILYQSLRTVTNSTGANTQYIPVGISFKRVFGDGSLSSESDQHSAPINIMPPYVSLFLCRKK